MGLCDLEDAVLGLVQDLVHLPLAGLVGVADDLGRRLDEAPQQRPLPHDAGVVLDVGGRGDRVQQLDQVLQAAGRAPARRSS